MKNLIIPILLGLSFILSACDKADDGKMPKITPDEMKNEVNEKAAQEHSQIE